MSTQTLAELAKHIDDGRVRGLAEVIHTTNPIWTRVPMRGFPGGSILVNREATLGDAGLYSVGDTITDRTPSTAAQISFTNTKLIGQVDLDKEVQAKGQSDSYDTAGAEIASKGKSIARLMQTQMASGDGAAPNTYSWHALCDSSQFTTASSGQDLSFELLWELLDLVKAKDGEVDYIVSHSIIVNLYKSLCLTLGGAAPTDVYTLPDGQTRTVVTFEDIPWFKNDYLSVAETANGAALTGGALCSVYAGCWDDGTGKVGAAMIYPEGIPAGIRVENVGTSETKDEEIYRILASWGFVNFNYTGLARLTSVNKTITP